MEERNGVQDESVRASASASVRALITRKQERERKGEQKGTWGERKQRRRAGTELQRGVGEREGDGEVGKKEGQRNEGRR